MRQHFISSVRPLLWDPKMVTSSCCWQVCKLPELVNIKARKDEGNLGLYAHGFWFLVCVTNNAVDVQFSNSMRGFSRVIWKETEVSYTNWKSVGNVYDCCCCCFCFFRLTRFVLACESYSHFTRADSDADVSLGGSESVWCEVAVSIG